MEISLEAWAGRSSRHANPRDHGYGAIRTVMLAQACNHPLQLQCRGEQGDRAVTRTPVGAIGPREYTSWSGEDGAFEHSECVALDYLDIGARVTRAASILTDQVL